MAKTPARRPAGRHAARARRFSLLSPARSRRRRAHRRADRRQWRGQNQCARSPLAADAWPGPAPGRTCRFRARTGRPAALPSLSSWRRRPARFSSEPAIEPGNGTSRKFRVDREPAASIRAFCEHIRVVWLTPAMDGLFSGPAGDRRRFLDRMVLSIDADHGARVNALERALRGRNRLLEDRLDQAGRVWLDAIEREIAELAVAVAAARFETVAKLAALIARGEEQGAGRRAISFRRAEAGRRNRRCSSRLGRRLRRKTPIAAFCMTIAPATPPPGAR